MTDRICAVPDCGRVLAPASKTGVCREHNHAAGFCNCIQCSRTEPTKRKPGPRKYEYVASAKAPRKPDAPPVGAVLTFTATIPAPLYRTLRDRAEASKVSLNKVITTLLAVAVEVDDLDTHFPMKP